MTVRGVLLDLEGVLYETGAPIEGAFEAVDWLEREGFTLRFLTNTTTRPRRDIVEAMRRMGFGAEERGIFSPSVAAAGVLKKAGIERIHLAAYPALAQDFTAFELADEKVEAVIMGDIDEQFTWVRMNGLFRLLLDGARLIALHKNRYCRRAQGLSLDLGPFVAALEYAVEAEAMVVGKPSRPFFTMALEDMGLAAEEVMMVGDDLWSDIGGGREAGLITVQVKTGKYRPDDDSHPSIRPHHRLASVKELPTLLKARG